MTGKSGGHRLVYATQTCGAAFTGYDFLWRRKRSAWVAKDTVKLPNCCVFTTVHSHFGNLASTSH